VIAWADLRADPRGAMPVEAPAAVLLLGAATSERREALRRLAAGILREPGLALVHRDGFAPRVAGPDPDRLRLSSASRSPFAALAASPWPIGIDVEVVDERAEPPWGVLHPAERHHLRALAAESRAVAAARLWSVKEAYLKAIRRGLSRDPASFAVLGLNGARPLIDDPLAPAPVVHLATRTIAAGETTAMVAVVVLGRSP
jgi:hypothetical protein